MGRLGEELLMSGGGRLGFLSTRVGRRLLVHFLSAALLPVLAVAAVGFWTVQRTVTDDAEQRVARLAKAASLTLLGALDAERATPSEIGASGLPELPLLSDDERAHLDRGNPLLVVHSASDDAHDAKLEFVRGVGTAQQRQRLDAAHLWSSLAEVVEGERSVFCVFAGREGVRVRCSSDATPDIVARLRAVANSSEGNSGATVGRDFVFGHRQLFLRFSYGADEWRLITAESTDDVLAPLEQLRTTLALLVALAVVVAFALAHRQIRRSTAPLVQLTAGTSRVVAGDLATPVTIAPGDEYADLGDAFNLMTGTLSDQLALLTRMDAIDEAALREREQSAIIAAAIGHLCAMPGCARVAMAIRSADDAERVNVTWVDPAAPRPVTVQRTWTETDRQLLERATPPAATLSRHEAPGYLTPGPVQRVERQLSLFPLVHDAELLGVLALSSGAADGFATQSVADIRRIADRVTMGIANTMLMERLNAQSLGAMRAFATAIDANSSWTAGHSERVTRVAISLATELGCSPSELDQLARGCLLHDIGKIGVPAAILDKPGRLTDDERAIIQRHPVIGVQILAPLPVFASILPIVRSHHERIDGMGYPDRLSGEEIPWLARITAVADVFDALMTDRPYRPGMSVEQTLAIIMADSGRAFDPRVVDALVALQRRGALLPHRGDASEEQFNDVDSSMELVRA
jgi:putative nucleotidyltransferase with HDIG domain